MKERSTNVMPNPLGMLGLVAAITLFVVAGCSDNGSTNGPQQDAFFSPALVTIAVGDTVVWSSTQGDHTVTSGSSSDDPNAGTIFDEDLDSGQTVRLVFTAVDTFPYFCRVHEDEGMKGTVIVNPAVEKFTFTMSASAFSPGTRTIQVGDSIEFRNTSGVAHTTTSGLNAADPNAGNLWDTPLAAGASYTRVFNQAGMFPFFCRNHPGMTGTITVQERTSSAVHVEAVDES